MINLAPHANGIVLRVKAQPGARRNGIVGVHDGMVKIAVTAPADRGKANKALIELLADLLGLKKALVSLLSGATGHEKRFLLKGVDANTIQARLASLLG